MSEILTIQLPTELCRYSVSQRTLVKKYHTNQVIKALESWIILKNLSVPSLIQSWNQQKQCLLLVLKINEQTLRSRLNLLQQMKLLTYDRHNIRLCSWDELGMALHIDITNKIEIQYDYTDKKRLQEWFIATEITDNQNRQAYKIMQKLNKNPDQKLKILHAMIAAGADRSQITDPGYILSWLKVLYQNDFYRASDIHDVLIELRPDTNRSIKGISRAWNAKHPTTICYWKKLMAKKGIIDVAKLQILSTERVRNKYCDIKWLKETKQTLLCLCDQITVLTPWLLTSDLKKQMAA